MLTEPAVPGPRPGPDQAPGAAPIGRAEAERLLRPFERFPAVLLAVSGGPDSVALLLLAARLAAERGAPRLFAATVDHGLRPESAAEAAAVAALCVDLGVPHRILRWAGEKPATGIEAAAREARYRLLGALAAELGCPAIATAHTLDDQAETVLLRLAAGSGPAGLAAMRPDTARGALRQLRPLLDVPKARLVATVRAADLRAVEDPMNADPRIARARLRRARAVLEREGLTAARLAQLARRMGRAEAALEAQTEAALRALTGEGAADRIAGPAWLALPEEIALRVLARMIGRAGAEAPPRLARLEALAEAVRAALTERRALGRTLGGAKVEVVGGGSQIVVRPAPPRRPSSGAVERSLIRDMLS